MNKKINHTIIYSMILFLLINVSFLSAQTVDQTVEQIKTKYSTLKSFHAEFNGSYSYTGNERKVRIEGELFYQKTNKIRLNTKRRTIVSDGVSTWTFDSKLNRVVISESKGDVKQFSPEYYIVEYASKSRYELIEENNGVIAIKFIPYVTGLAFDYAILWFDKNFIITKVEAKDPSGTLVELSFNDVKLNTTIKQDIFTFIPPQNIKVIDLR